MMRRAIAVLKENLARHPDDRDTLMALINFSREAGDAGAALQYAEQLARIAPADSDLAGLIQDFQRQIQKTAAQ